jgi:cysteine desulfurase
VERVYLDYCATAPLKPAAADAMTGVMTGAMRGATGNPSSVHSHGRAARRLLEDARDQAARLVGAAAAGVIFTAGGTEADNMALCGFPDRRVIVSAIEHDAVLAAAGDGAARLPVGADGVVDLAALEAALRDDPRPALVSLMSVNNETGVIQPVAEAARLAHAYGALLHCDAVQAAGKLPLDMTASGCDLLSLSAHKLGGPTGIGALILADGIQPQALIRGGGQERGVRAGTHNLIGAVGFAAAAAAAGDDLADSERLRALRDGIEAELLGAIPDLIVAGGSAARVGSTSCLVLPGFPGERMVMRLDLAGISVSAGAACSSGKIKPSHVLGAMGFSPENAACAVRVSLGWGTSENDARRFVEAYTACCAGRRRTV